MAACESVRTIRVGNDDLSARWQALLVVLQPATEPRQPVCAELIAAYQQPARAYHNLDHLRYMFAIIDRLASCTEDMHAVELAAWFHDAVYDPRAHDNEEQSAALAERRLRELGLPPALIAQVCALILLTKSHQPASVDKNGQVLCDADLAILGSENGYLEYAAAIRQEYSWVPEPDYRKGRAAVLESFLKRKHIYHTEIIRLEREERARANVQRELDRLRA
ncbi:MAG: metal-dependent phosphohydrolase [Gemmataceae bacterium]